MIEPEFTADVASWINELIRENPNLPFSRAKCEQRSKGSLKKRDLTLLDKNSMIVLTGEVKLPFRKDGGSPYNANVVADARKKATRAKTSFFFTWNVNEFVLWETKPARTSWQEQDYKSWSVTNVHKESHLELPVINHAIQGWLSEFLQEFGQILLGTTSIGRKSPDEKFVDALESALQMPIVFTTEELTQQYKKTSFHNRLDQWMREEQGWIIYTDNEGILENLERAAKFTCYALVNKLVFYEALLKRFGTRMIRLNVPEHIKKADELRLHLECYFAEAKNITGDYETVFGEDHKSIGNRIPFYSDQAVPHWRALINQIHHFDFSKLDYEVIGGIFEHLISPEERHKYGQFYTKVEVVDLINSFCIKKGDEKVMDPACGGGTFLVRAYARKRELMPSQKHSNRLIDLFGVDISLFATHLTTINLATRDLIDAENYPQIARTDFFDVQPHRTFLSLPSHIETKGLGKIQQQQIQLPQLDAVVGNPPYIRQEDIPKSKNKSKPKKGTKEYYRQLVLKEEKADFSGRSDIHCYFWPHATSFLKKDGYLCFLTSSQWLDVEYGFKLQEWILRNFEIVTVFESIDEPWFVGARVVTAITILRHQQNEQKRMNNIVRFVQLRRPIKEIISNDGTTAGAMEAADAFRDEILKLNKNTVNERYRARLVCQADLWRNGVELGVIMAKSTEKNDTDLKAQTGKYYGGKWGMYLRAPDLWFEILDNYGNNLAPLGYICDVDRGVTSGQDRFFYVKDCSLKCLESYKDHKEFENSYGVTRNEVQSGKIKLVLCGEGSAEIHAIEAEYLEPEIHSIMEINNFVVRAEDCSRFILLVDENKSQLKGKYVYNYIKWGEKKGWDKGITCAARVTENREWYDLTGHHRALALWPKERQYRHIAPANPSRLIANCRLYEIYPPCVHNDPDLWGGILNSTLVLLSSFQFGRPMGNEGNWSTMVIDVNLMLVPDPSKAKEEQLGKVISAFRKIKKRRPIQFLSEYRLREMSYMQDGKEEELSKLSDLCELDMEDRRELDDSVLELLGIENEKNRKKIIDELYSYLKDFFEWTRQKEEKAIANKKKTKRKGPAKAAEIAQQIFEQILEEKPGLIKRYEKDFLDASKPFDTYEIPSIGIAEIYSDMLTPNAVRFVKGKTKEIAMIETRSSEQSQLIASLIKSGIKGFVRIPHQKEDCRKVLTEYDRFTNMRDRYIIDAIKERTADEEMQEKIYEAILPMFLRTP